MVDPSSLDVLKKCHGKLIKSAHNAALYLILGLFNLLILLMKISRESNGRLNPTC